MLGVGRQSPCLAVEYYPQSPPFICKGKEHSFMGEVKVIRCLEGQGRKKQLFPETCQNEWGNWRLWAFFPLGGLNVFSLSQYLQLSCQCLPLHSQHSVFTFKWANAAFHEMARRTFHFLLPTTQQHTWMSSEMLRNAEVSRWNTTWRMSPRHYLVSQMWHCRIFGPWEVAFIL